MASLEKALYVWIKEIHVPTLVKFCFFHVYYIYSLVKILLSSHTLSTLSFRNKITTIIKSYGSHVILGKVPVECKGFIFNKRNREINISFTTSNY